MKTNSWPPGRGGKATVHCWGKQEVSLLDLKGAGDGRGKPLPGCRRRWPPKVWLKSQRSCGIGFGAAESGPVTKFSLVAGLGLRVIWDVVILKRVPSPRSVPQPDFSGSPNWR